MVIDRGVPVRRVLGCAVAVALAVSGVLVVAPSSPALAAGQAETIELASLPEGPHRFVDAAYRDLLGRTSDAGGRQFWVDRLASGVTRTRITFEMAHSTEWTRRVVRSRFLDVIGREPTTPERDAWVAQLRARRTMVSDLMAFLYGSAAFYTQTGSTAGGWVDAVYQRIVFRAPTTTERNAAISALGTSSRETVARSLVLSVEANGFRVDDLYRVLLGRAAEPDGRIFWAGRLTTGDDLKLAAQLAGSAEYNATAQGRVIDGTLQKPATTSVVGAGQVRSLTTTAGDDGPSIGDTATMVVAAAAVPAGTTHVSVPITTASPQGFLGEVTSRSGSGSTVTVGLRRTPLSEVFTSADFSGIIDLPQPVGTGSIEEPAATSQAGRSRCQAEGSSFKFSAVARPKLVVEGKWSPFGGASLTFAAKGYIGASVDVLLGGAFACEFPVRRWTTLFFIGPVPFVADIKPTFTVKGELGAHITASYGFACTVGAHWDGDVENLTGCKKETSTSTFSPALAQGNVSVTLSVAVSVEAAGTLGVALDMGAVLTGAVTPLATPWWKVTAAATAGFKLVADVWILSVNIELARFNCCVFTIARSSGPPPLAITTTSLPVGTKGVPYTAALAAKGGVPPYGWTASNLPPGLSLSNGIITGTPTTSGDRTVAITVRDATGTTATTSRDLAVGDDTTPSGTTISASGGHTCAVLGNGTVRCWGANLYGRLGDGTTTDRLTPVTVSGLTGAVAVTAGSIHTCALLEDRTVRCWGHNPYGQLGDGTTTDRLTPVTVSGLTGAVTVTAGYVNACALLGNGTVRCWGSNHAGQLGDGTRTNRSTPVTVSGLTGAVAVTTGDSHTCAVLGNGTIRCWGDNRDGRLGDGTTTNRLTPVTVPGLTGAVAVTANRAYYTCAVLEDGTVRCWGWNGYGQLGDGTRTNRTTPVTVSGLTGAVTATTGFVNACALLGNGTVRCWGDNDYGQLGDGTRTDRLTPVTVSGL